jgi:hypothetical protein
MQVTKAYRKEIISEVAAMCGDDQYRDFKREIYGQAVYRATRELAHAYSIFEYELVFKVEAFELNNWLVLPSSNFKAELEVRVNNLKYYKTNGHPTAKREYAIKLGEDGRWLINYHEKTANDTVYVRYMTLGKTAEEFDGDPLIPNKYYEELLQRSILYIAKMGVAKFSAEGREKYKLLIQMYKLKDVKDSSMAKDDNWITIKPFDVFRTIPPADTTADDADVGQYKVDPPGRGDYA